MQNFPIYLSIFRRDPRFVISRIKKKKKKKSRILIHPSPSSILSLFLHSLTHRELNSRKRSNLPLRFPDGEQTSALLFPLFFSLPVPPPPEINHEATVTGLERARPLRWSTRKLGHKYVSTRDLPPLPHPELCVLIRVTKYIHVF